MASYLLLVACIMLSGCAVVRPAGFTYQYSRGRMVLLRSCYMFVWNKYTWHQARNNCKRHGGHLVSIETRGENLYLVGIMQRHHSLGYWTGGNDLSHEGHWQWEADGSGMSYTDWKTNQPDNWRGNEHCLHLFKYDFGFKWNDITCQNQYASICEKPC